MQLDFWKDGLLAVNITRVSTWWLFWDVRCWSLGRFSPEISSTTPCFPPVLDSTEPSDKEPTQIQVMWKRLGDLDFKQGPGLIVAD